MPWGQQDAPRSTKKANTPKKKRQWAKVANTVLKRTGDEARAKRAANSAVKKTTEKRRHQVRHRGKTYTFK